MHLFHETVGGWMESRCAGKVDATDVGQGVEQLRFELPTLVGGNGLRTSVTRYPFRYEDSGYRLRRKFHQGDGFRPARKAVYGREAVSETVRCRQRADDVDV